MLHFVMCLFKVVWFECFEYDAGRVELAGVLSFCRLVGGFVTCTRIIVPLRMRFVLLVGLVITDLFGYCIGGFGC